MNKYYVYTYIDPRNLEEFYYGKGQGSRKHAHLFDVADNEKAERIRKIKKAGLEPTIRVIAAGLTEADALLVEATLLWKLGKGTANIVAGHFKENFRPQDTYHRQLSGFDYQTGIYYYNVGEGQHRNWDDYRSYGFISAGQGPVWRKSIGRLHSGDVIAAYVTRTGRGTVRGFVGIGKILEPARRIRDVEIGGKKLLDLKLKCANMGDNSDDAEKSEYVALVEWVKAVPREEAKWKPRSGLFTSQHVSASLDNQPSTVEFLGAEFGVDLKSLLI